MKEIEYLLLVAGTDKINLNLAEVNSSIVPVVRQINK